MSQPPGCWDYKRAQLLPYLICIVKLCCGAVDSLMNWWCARLVIPAVAKYCKTRLGHWGCLKRCKMDVVGHCFASVKKPWFDPLLEKKFFWVTWWLIHLEFIFLCGVRSNPWPITGWYLVCDLYFKMCSLKMQWYTPLMEALRSQVRGSLRPSWST